MSAIAPHPLAKVFEREIARFVAAASRGDCTDLYRNRRSSARYHRSWPLLVTPIGQGDASDLSATLHDVSSGGIGFFCDSGFPVGTFLGIKLFWSDPDTPRIPAVVRHTRITQEGVLLGTRFIVNSEKLCTLIDNGRHAWYG
jgi:hypothetical protein